MKTSDIQVTPIHPERWGDDLDVANAARVSFHKDASNYTKEENDKLIRYLAKHQHFSPFNHSFLSFRIKAPIFVARQLVKHKYMPWNEVSRRYVDEEPEFYIPDFRLRSINVKQGSSDEVIPGIFGEELRIHYRDSCKQALLTYDMLLDAGVAPEVARSVLPQNMHTEWLWSGTLGAFASMLKLRLDPHTQYESRIVAQQVAKHVKEVFPVSYAALIGE